ncbi:cytochrome P450 family protein [Pleurotus pulmonarius]
MHRVRSSLHPSSLPMLQFIALLVFASLLPLTAYYWRRKPKLPLPPGPKRYPIVGNFFNLPSKQQWIKFLQWSKEYNSDIIHFRIFGRSTIVLNSWKATNDLLSVRSVIYSDRPVSTMMNELLGWAPYISVMPYGDAWRTRRRAFWEEFNPSQAPDHRPKQLWYSRDLLRRLLKEPANFLHHIEYTLSASILAVTYGLDVKPEHDPNIARAEKALSNVTDAGISGSFLVDTMPFLKHVPSWMPGAGFKRFAEKSRPDVIDMLNGPFYDGCKRIQEGKGEPSFLSRSLAKGGHIVEGHPNAQFIKEVAAVAYSGGAETTRSALSSFIAAMLLHPEVQMKGQREVDSCSRSRLPSFEDLPQMPYVQAIMLEVLRWQAVFPLGVAHRVTMDDEYKGYHIPKGSTVFVNVWALLRDEEYYPDPDTFRPERFLTKDGKINPKRVDPIPNFGFGRRICPGRFFATDSLWLAVASILAVFDIAKATDEAGEVIQPDIQWSSAVTRHINPFKCSITPRSLEAEKLIRDSEFIC